MSARAAMDAAVARFTREHGPMPAWEFQAHAAADPRLPSTELGELAAVEFRLDDGMEETHEFGRPLPLLSYHDGGLLISGGAYTVEPGRIVNRRATAPTRTKGKASGAAVEAAIERYARDHWGQTGPRRVTRARAADPSRLSQRFGEFVAVIYRTKKGSDRELTDYRHPFKKPRPTLSYHEGGLIISGGVYHVTERGIVD